MIEKMKFLTFTGPKADIDRLVNQYLSKYEIHLENALTRLGQKQDKIKPFIEANPYRETLTRLKEYAAMLGEAEKSIPVPDAAYTLEEVQELLNSVRLAVTEVQKNEQELQQKSREISKQMQDIQPFRSLPCDMKQFMDFEFIRSRYGRISKQYYANFEQYVYHNLETVFLECSQDADYVWGVYFVPRTQQNKVNAVFSSMHFEPIYLQDVYEGTPEQAYHKLEEELSEIREQIRDCRNYINSLLKLDAPKILSAIAYLERVTANFDIRRMAGCVRENSDEYYILCGWMAKEDANQLLREIKDDPDVVCVAEDDDQIDTKPPTKLKNPAPARPFEMYVKMYGLPGYGELDPTVFVALTYSFIFGAMFGDVGQGLCLVLGGFLLYRFKKMDLAGIIGTAGIFSTIFGFLFGSFFGFEDVLPALWLKPVTAMMDVPVLGRMNTVFVAAIGFGMILNLLVMVLNIINGLKSRDPGQTFLSANSAAGLVFYGSLFLSLLLIMTGHKVPGGIVLAVMFGLPLLVVFLKEPLEHVIEHKKPIEGGAGLFFVQAFFELFDVCLSYFSNTVSFVRIGAFAVSHAAMMEVVLMLAGAEAGGNPNWLVVVLGNIFVCAMEGLIVGIQVLRLEYYELFSRFYKGDGKPFVPFLKTKS